MRLAGIRKAEGVRGDRLTWARRRSATYQAGLGSPSWPSASRSDLTTPKAVALRNDIDNGSGMELRAKCLKAGYEGQSGCM